MTAIQLAMICGLGIGLGSWLILRGALPSHPHLGAALANLADPGDSRQLPAPADLTGRVGAWAGAAIPAVLGRTRKSDLALLQVDPAQHAGEKVLGAVFGLLAPSLIVAAASLVGLTIPIGIPVAAGIGFAALLFVAPDLSLRTRARERRVEFARALAAYMDLVALERTAAAGVTEAMESAAAISGAEPFARIRETLTNARLAGTPPWEGLAAMGADIDVPELGDLSNIMRLAGEQSSASAGSLKARAAGIRNGLAEDSHASANAAGERMMVPLALLAFVYLAILAAPGVLRVLSSS